MTVHMYVCLCVLCVCVCILTPDGSLKPLHFNERVMREWFSFNICWYSMESMIPCILTRCPGSLEEKQPHNIKDPPPYFTVGMRCFSVWLSFCLRQTQL